MPVKYRFVSQNPSIDLIVDPGPGAPTPTAGYGGWEEVKRPSDVALTDWSGNTPFKQDILVMLDGWSDGQSVEPQLDLLEQLGRAKKEDDEPPVFRVFGPLHNSGMHYVLEGIDFGAALRDSKGTLVRQELTLHLMEYVRPDRIRLRKKKKGSGKNKDGKDYNTTSGGSGGIGPGPSVYTTKAGDTLRSIAAKFYGKASLWMELGELNQVRDPNKVLPVGTKVKLPAWL